MKPINIFDLPKDQYGRPTFKNVGIGQAVFATIKAGQDDHFITNALFNSDITERMAELNAELKWDVRIHDEGIDLHVTMIEGSAEKDESVIYAPWQMN